MGFIASEINKEHDKYILLEDIVLLVQELDGDNPSLSDTAKFLLQKYEEHYIDDNRPRRRGHDRRPPMFRFMARTGRQGQIRR